MSQLYIIFGSLGYSVIPKRQTNLIVNTLNSINKSIPRQLRIKAKLTFWIRFLKTSWNASFDSQPQDSGKLLIYNIPFINFTIFCLYLTQLHSWLLISLSLSPLLTPFWIIRNCRNSQKNVTQFFNQFAL